MVSSGISEVREKKKRGYASSKLRVGLLAALMGAMFFVGTGWAQDAGAGGGAAAPARPGPGHIVLGTSTRSSSSSPPFGSS